MGLVYLLTYMKTIETNLSNPGVSLILEEPMLQESSRQGGAEIG